MQKWEYLVIRTAEGVVTMVNSEKAFKGRLFGGLEGEDTYAFFSRAGLDGWELVSAMSDVKLAHQLYFKRPIED